MGINNGIVILDVDDTLIKTQSQQLFIKYLLKKGLLSYLKYFKIMIWFIFYKLGFVSDPQKIAEYSFELFKDKNVSDIEKISKDFFDNNLSKYFYEEALNLLKEHKEKGRRIILLSNAIEIIIKEVANHLTINDYICTKLETKDGFFTGKISGNVTYGKNKVKKMLDFLQEKGISLEDQESWGYGDHFSDIFVLELVKYPFIVNPSTKLKKEAKKRGWQILEFKKIK
ncbi:hypothetical protein A2442_01455 [Candidatus Campbellbacteria bacterium RIFOXYC2_FULL_35_25]|uniref:HAD family hydrolase n=1 Tax=Candidatus Campbellbacteria bacterium RIFOXYC2_FULL_35_25 TaxID=1797582 RepID=A0A1F5EH62_9BACT|nr:MAG: hypothetical protein A2442_01455 [Candidatus Campbellbacteria bacterium RIFOXYC2_FULL_35_25]